MVVKGWWGDGEIGGRGAGEMGCEELFLVWENPGVWVVNHENKFSYDHIVSFVEFSACLGFQILAFDGELEPSLGLGSFGFNFVEFGNESGSVSTPTPCFCKIGTN